MRRRHGLVPLALLALIATACGKKDPEVVPTPDTGAPPSTTPTNPNTGTPANPGAPMTPNEAEIRARILADLANVIHFDYDQDAIKPEDRATLDRKADIMRANTALRIRISGHADDRGSDEYNLVLGNRRAVSAKQYLVGKGIDGGRIDVTSFGEERPVDNSGTESGWAQNRRAEFEITAGGERLVAPR